ncbi:hypothetical protein NC653_000174 [Populus alba x Populus x berolinensis]|uniref:Uncharacterized protein n=1 Tax=Populus alba x Populus x berolinensis TaxID=444605 RepID=A0AAD6WEZ3_9ROSI|nr:hypothetical protein NC653_000174 [Populus alba x Populus x berolinensis]
MRNIPKAYDHGRGIIIIDVWTWARSFKATIYLEKREKSTEVWQKARREKTALQAMAGHKERKLMFSL